MNKNVKIVCEVDKHFVTLNDLTSDKENKTVMLKDETNRIKYVCLHI